MAGRIAELESTYEAARWAVLRGLIPRGWLAGRRNLSEWLGHQLTVAFRPRAAAQLLPLFSSRRQQLEESRELAEQQREDIDQLR